MSDIIHVIRATVNPNAAPTRVGQHWINETTKVMWMSVGTSSLSDWIIFGDSPTVKITSNDTTADYLGSKLSAGAGIALAILNPGGDEIIEISAPDATTDEKVKISANDTTAGYLNPKLTVSNGINAASPLEKSITSPSSNEGLNLQFDQTKLSITASQVSDFSEAVDDRLASLLVAGAGISLSYNDPSNTLTISSTITQYTNEDAQDAVGGILTDTSSVDFTYNDAGNSISAAVIPGGVNHNLLANYVANEHINHSSVSLIAGTGISASGLGDLTSSRTINLANSGVTASSYGSASQVGTFTVDATGRLTAAANVAISLAASAITDFNEAAQDAVGGILTDTSSVDFTYNDAGNSISAAVIPGGVNHDALQNWVANKHIDHSAVSITGGTGLTGGGDITTSRTISMPNVGTPGTYGSATQVPVFTTDAQGRVTSVTNTSVTATVSITEGQVGFGDPSNLLTSDSNLFWDNTNKRLGIGTNAPTAQLHLADQNGQNAIFEQANNSLNESAYFEYRKSKGTLASKLAVAANDKLGGWGGFGWKGADYGFAGEMLFYAEAGFTDTSTPGYFIVSTTPVGSTSPVERLRINSTGLGIWSSALRIGSTTDTTNGNIRYDGSEFQIRESATWKPIAQTPLSFTSTTAQNSTSAAFAALSSISTTPAAGSYKLDFTASAQVSSATSTGEWAVFVDGVDQAVTRRRAASVSTTTIQNSVAISTIVTVNGSQVVEVRFRRSSGTGTVTTTERQMLLTPYSR